MPMGVRASLVAKTLFSAVVVCLSLFIPAGDAGAKCTLSQIVQLPITMDGMQPLVPVKFNGTEAFLQLASGSDYSLVTTSKAIELHLDVEHDRRVAGLVNMTGGLTRVDVTTVADFALAGVSVPKVEFLVGPISVSARAAGFMGQNVLGLADVEYDLGNGVLRYMKPEECGDEELAYWAAGKPYSSADIDAHTRKSPWLLGWAYINGVKIRIKFDTAFTLSMLTAQAAERAGVKLDAPGVREAGVVRNARPIRMRIAPVEAFRFGDEEIRNTRLRIADTNFGDIDMVIGVDFLLSHHVYVANGQHKLYFTYNGGPVFNLTTNGNATAAAADVLPSADSESEAPLDADALARRGEAAAARQEFQPAIADLTRATDLDPANAGYFFSRSAVYFAAKQTAPGTQDLDRAISLKPDFIDALRVRAELRFAAHDAAGVASDLDAMDRTLASDADLRLYLGLLYGRIDRFRSGVAQLDRWIEAHHMDSRGPSALNSRCWFRALGNFELEKAVEDCDVVLRRRPFDASYLNSRGMLRLRMGQYGKSVSDFDASLRSDPKEPWSLYGRAIAELREGKPEASRADMESALALMPDIAERLGKYGFAP